MEAEHIQQLKVLKEEVGKLNGRFNDQDEKLDEIYAAITGNAKLGNAGLVKRLERLEESEKRWDKFQYKAVGVIAGVTIVWEVFKSFIEFHFK